MGVLLVGPMPKKIRYQDRAAAEFGNTVRTYGIRRNAAARYPAPRYAPPIYDIPNMGAAEIPY